MDRNIIVAKVIEKLAIKIPQEVYEAWDQVIPILRKSPSKAEMFLKKFQEKYQLDEKQIDHLKREYEGISMKSLKILEEMLN